MDEVLAHALVPLLDARVVLYQHFLELDRRVKRAAIQDKVCMRMMTVPGVGPIAALTFKSAIDDPARFRRSRTVAAHLGLTPRRYQSGEHDNPSRISKASDRDVRATLYAAANALLMRTMAGSQIKSWGANGVIAQVKHHRQTARCVIYRFEVVHQAARRHERVRRLMDHQRGSPYIGGHLASICASCRPQPTPARTGARPSTRLTTARTVAQALSVVRA